MSTRSSMFRLFAAAAALSFAISCSEDSDNPMGPGGGGGSPGPSGATITIGPNGVSPSTVTINPGESVTFVNNDSRQREMTSDPHPLHTDCPAINALGVLNVGQTRLTNALTASRTCRFHDHANNDTDPNHRGQIVIR